MVVVCSSAMLLVGFGLLLVSWPSTGDAQVALCSGVEDCAHNTSALCVRNFVQLTCKHQLHHATTAGCQMEYIPPTECRALSLGALYPPESLPFQLGMYHYKTWFMNRATPNLTFPNLSTDFIQIRYEHENPALKRSLCRNFKLSNVSLPLMDIIYWDCPIFSDTNYVNNPYRLTISDWEHNIGGSYTFRIPHKRRINIKKTKIENWQVFFFLHKEHIFRTHQIPVSLQPAPFSNITYELAVAKCFPKEEYHVDDLCTNRTVLFSHHIKGPQSVDDPECCSLITEILPNNPQVGVYVVTVTILSPLCPSGRCYESLSVPFEFTPSGLVPILLIMLGGIIVIFLIVFILLHLYKGQQQKLEKQLTSKESDVLLIYLAESYESWSIIKAFAVFLQDHCYLHPLLVDVDNHTHNPNIWLTNMLRDSHKVAFIIPSNLNATSVMPICNGWLLALHYFVEQAYLIHNFPNKFACFHLPTSSRTVPPEISHLKKFFVVHDLPSLVCWAHGGSFMDTLMFWGPQLSNRFGEDKMEKLKRILSDTPEKHNKSVLGTIQIPLLSGKDITILEHKSPSGNNTPSEELSLTSNATSCTEDSYLGLSDARNGSDSSLNKGNSEFVVNKRGEVFDPNLLNVNELPLLGEETVDRTDSPVDESHETESLLEDDAFL